jgi:hypothetical protein
MRTPQAYAIWVLYACTPSEDTGDISKAILVWQEHITLSSVNHITI